LLYADYTKSQAELARRNTKEYASQMEFECAKVRGDFLSYKMEYQTSCNKFNQTINNLNQTISEMENKLSVHQDTISILKQQKDAQIKLYKTREDKEIEKVIKLENKVKVLDNIVYKTGQSVQTMNMLNSKCQTSFIKPEYLKKAKQANPRLALNEEMVVDLRYFNSFKLEVDSLTSQLDTQRTQFVNEIDRLSREYYYADRMHAILGVYTELDEVTNLQFQKHAINLELELKQCKEKIKNDMSFKVNKSKDFCKEREQYFEIQDLKAQLQDKVIAISELKKLIEKLKGKYVETKFEKSLVIRQPNAFKSQRPSILGKPTTFSNSFVRKDFSKSTSVTQTHVSNDFSKPVTTQILPANKKSILKNTNVLNPGMYKIHTDHTQTRTSKLPPDSRKTNKHVTFSTGVIPSTSVSRPQLKSNHMEDRVLRTNSRGKKQEVENHRKNVKLPKNKMSLVEIILFIVDSGCSKHMTGNLKLLINFVEKFLGTVKFRNDQIGPILGYGDLVQGAITIKRVYYVEGLNHNLFSVGQFYDADLEVAFRKSTCFIRDLKGNDLLSGSRDTDLYSITLQDTNSPNLICLVAKAASSQAWLWHHRLSHLNFDTINLLSKNDIVVGLPKVKFVKDHLCSSCELGKAKRKSFHTKLTPNLKRRLQLLHMDLCGPKQTLHAYFAAEGIQDQTSVARTPEQNGVVKRRNRTLVEAAQKMLSAAKVPLFFWAEAIATACFTQNRSLIIPHHEKTPYHIINDRKPSVKFFYIFGSVCYNVRDGENLDKMKEKGDECIFMGYSNQSKAYRVFNKRT
nr:integrase, catalytic region, zinc finger, CCHC-type, peptidase aspartic, catalytic [Tanacetum cinerariifolium]